MAGSTWPTLAAGAKAKASEVEAKFDWLEQDILPMAGGAKADATYDVGSASFRFRDGWLSRNLSVGGGGSAAAPALALGGSNRGIYNSTTVVGISIGGTSMLEAYSGGWVLHPNQPGFFSYINTLSVNNVTGQNEFWTMTTNTTTVNNGGMFATATSKATVPVTGLYLFGASVHMSGATVTSHVRRLRFYVDSSETYTHIEDSTYDEGVVQTVVPLYLTAGKVVHANFQVNGIGATSVDIDGINNGYQTNFWGVLIF